MRKARIPSKAAPPAKLAKPKATPLPNEAEVLRRRLAEAEAELEFYRSKHDWLQAALASQRHARQMLEASVAAGYKDTVARIHDAVRSLIPEGATVLVISKGDQELLNLEKRRGWHFPQDEDGGYAGYYPADSAEAIVHLRSLIAKGAEFLLVPNTGFWWLEHYRDLDEWLAKAHAPVWRDERCAIYKLHREAPAPLAPQQLGAPAPPPALGASPQPARLEGCIADRGAPTRQRLGGAVASQQLARLARPLNHPGEILCFPIIDWDFRFQRPQQLMLQFANAGYRVFYASHQFRKSGQPYSLRLLAGTGGAGIPAGVLAGSAGVPAGGSLWELSLLGPRFNPHQGLLDSAHCDRLAQSLSVLRRDHLSGTVALIVQSPFWWPFVKQAAAAFAWPIIYDCMDYQPGFASSNPVLVEQERELLARADLVVASSALLEQHARRYSRKVLLVRNGCEYEHFARIKPRPPGPRPVIGYYGAIADWFDADLVADLAERRLDWDFLLVGSTFSADLHRLSKLPNILLPGEKPYAEIPDWLAKFDVAILPFKRTSLTEAANPVKAYEILASGKPLVSIPLPEMVPLAPLVQLATTAEQFEQAIQAELGQESSEDERKRRTFAEANTWQQRFEQLSAAVQELPLIQ